MRIYKDVFISYSRRQLLFASHLAQQLTAQGFSVWFDQNDIPLAVDFLDEIERSVRQAHNFLFLLSPDSAASPYCKKEIEYALENGKRIIPLLCVATTDEEVRQLPEVIARLNWINGITQHDDERNKLVAEVTEVLRNGGEVVKMHTELLSRAAEWKMSYLDRFLLSGTLRHKAQTWLFKAAGEMVMQSCQPTDLLCSYICESRKKADDGATDFFISYASDDRVIRDKVFTQLTRSGFTSWKHDADINLGVQFGQAILEGIENSDNLLLLLSPASLASEYCLRELDYAASINKRILILAVAPVDGLELPPSIAGLQYLPYTDEGDAGISEALLRLVREVESERMYYARHRELLVRALRWDKSARQSSYLLRGSELLQAETWLAVAASRAVHPAPPVVSALVRESAQTGVLFSCQVLIGAAENDSDFAERLAHALRRSGQSAYFNPQPAGQQATDEMSGAENFLLVLSSSSLTSGACSRMRELAEKNGKRIILASCEIIEPEELPSEWQTLATVSFGNGGGDFETGLGQLLHLLSFDREYITGHTRWLQAALAWEASERSPDQLPRGKTLTEARQWFDHAQGEPPPTTLQREFFETAVRRDAEEKELELRRENYLRELERENQDLKRSEELMGRIGLVDSVSGEDEDPVRLPVNTKLFGREKELATFMQWQEEAKEGGCCGILVEGDEGAGKTHFLRTAGEQLVSHGYLYLSCTVQEDESSPFEALAGLADELAAQLLKDESKVQALRRRLEEALRGNGKVLTDLMPRLELLLGSQPPVPELDPHQSRQRLRISLAAFLGAVAEAERPLAIVVNQLHFANESLLDLLSFLLSPGAALRHFLLVGSCITGVAAVKDALERGGGQSGERLHQLALLNLRQPELTEWLSGLLNVPPFAASLLAEGMIEKTDGNPLLVEVLLQHMHAEKIIRWNTKARSWYWDLAALKQLRFGNDAEELARNAILQLSVEEQQALAAAACIGAQFPLDLLAVIYQKVFLQPMPDLLRLARERILVPAGDAYKLLLDTEEKTAAATDAQFRFANSRLRQAALVVIPAETIQIIRLEVGLHLLRRYKRQATTEDIYNTANHINEVSDILRGKNAKLTAAQINLQAGELALQSSAYKAALGYFAHGIEFITSEQEAWDVHYELCFRLHSLHANALFFSGMAEAASQEMEKLIGFARGLHDKANGYIAFCRALQSVGKAAESLARARQGLALFGIGFPETEEAYAAETAELMELLSREGVTRQFEEMTVADEEHLLIGEFYKVCVMSIYFVEPHHLPWICSRNLAHVFQYGYTSGARQAMAWFSMILMMTGHRERSLEYAALALDNSAKNTDPALSRGQTTLIAWAMSLGWKYPFAKSAQTFEQAFHQCQDNGDPQYASYVLISIYISKLMQADDMPALLRLCQNWRDHCLRFAPLEYGQALIRTAMLQRLMDIEPSGPKTDPEKIISEYEAARNSTDVCESLIELARMSLLFNEDEQAFMYCKRADPLIAAGAAGTLLLNFLHHFVFALCSARIYQSKQQSGETLIAQQYAAQGESLLEQLRSWAEFQPANFAVYTDLAEAEWAAAKGEEEKAVPLYLSVAAHPRENDFPLLRALAHEGLARYFHARGYRFAGAHAEEAVLYYAQCGARGKARQLENWLNNTEGLLQPASLARKGRSKR